jgi:ABC-type glutathione transport system ATPase component
VKPPLLEVRGLAVNYGAFRAVEGVSFDVAAGETLALIGESGSGKTTIGRAVLRLVPLAAGTVRFDGADVSALRGAALLRFRREAQVVFQDPQGSLDPRMRIGATVAEGLAVHGLRPWDVFDPLALPRELLGLCSRGERRAAVVALLERVGLDPGLLDRFPHELSGGQRQRVGIARALAVSPRLIVCDECVSALDVSVQAQVLNLLRDLQEERGLAYLFISHDLAAVRHMSARVAVLAGGRIVEQGPADAVYGAPSHEHTRRLLESAPRLALARGELRRA